MVLLHPNKFDKIVDAADNEWCATDSTNAVAKYTLVKAVSRRTFQHAGCNDTRSWQEKQVLIAIKEQEQAIETSSNNAMARVAAQSTRQCTLDKHFRIELLGMRE